MIKSFCLAPMEGITGYVFRNAFHQCFRGVTHYMSPFISPGHRKQSSLSETCFRRNSDGR